MGPPEQPFASRVRCLTLCGRPPGGGKFRPGARRPPRLVGSDTIIDRPHLTSVDTEAWSRRYHFQVSQTCLPGAFCCWFGLRGSLWLPLSLPLASDQFFTLNSLLRTRIRSQAAMWVSYRPDQAWVALLLNIASSISCHKLAGVALARCLSRQVKNDPPTADRTAQLAGWAMGVLGRPIPRAPGAGGGI